MASPGQCVFKLWTQLGNLGLGLGSVIAFMYCGVKTRDVLSLLCKTANYETNWNRKFNITIYLTVKLKKEATSNMQMQTSNL